MVKDNGKAFVILGLLLVHALTDVVIAVYGTRGFDPAVIDLLAGALSRCQICLLTIWLVAGSERFTWRLCALLAGSSLAFVIFSRTLTSSQLEIGSESTWFAEEWRDYFRLAGPGDLLIKLPVLIGGVAAPLLLWRLRARRSFLSATEESRSVRLGRFSLHDVAIWTGTTCTVLVSFFQTAPYDGWLGELGDQWLSYYRLQRSAAVYRISSGLMDVIVALTTLWLVYGKSPLRVRGPISCALVLGTALGLREWRRAVDMASDYDFSEIWGSVIAATTIIATLWLVKLYESNSADA